MIERDPVLGYRGPDNRAVVHKRQREVFDLIGELGARTIELHLKVLRVIGCVVPRCIRLDAIKRRIDRLLQIG